VRAMHAAQSSSVHPHAAHTFAGPSGRQSGQGMGLAVLSERGIRAPVRVWTQAMGAPQPPQGTECVRSVRRASYSA